MYYTVFIVTLERFSPVFCSLPPVIVCPFPLPQVPTMVGPFFLLLYYYFFIHSSSPGEFPILFSTDAIRVSKFARDFFGMMIGLLFLQNMIHCVAQKFDESVAKHDKSDGLDILCRSKYYPVYVLLECSSS